MAEDGFKNCNVIISFIIGICTGFFDTQPTLIYHVLKVNDGFIEKKNDMIEIFMRKHDIMAINVKALSLSVHYR